MALDPGSHSDEELRALIDSVPHWYHQIQIRPGIVTPGINDSQEMLRLLDLPDDASGRRVLDIGVRDGFFAFELERRGADVLGIDYLDPAETGFPVAKRLLNSRVEYRVENVYRLDPETHGEFDIVLFLGVLYHLRDPLLALDLIWDISSDDALLVVETQLIDHALRNADGSFAPLAPELRDVALMQFYPGDSLHGDPTNYWAPNLACLQALVATAGFRVDRAEIAGSRGIVHACKITHPARLYQRRLEKGTSRQAGARPVVVNVAPREATDAPPLPGDSDEVKRLQHNLAILHNEKVGLHAELAAAQGWIGALEDELAGARGRIGAVEDELAGAQGRIGELTRLQSPTSKQLLRELARRTRRKLRRRI